jgi:hypothetical protein
MNSVPIHSTTIVSTYIEATVRTVILLYDRGCFDFERLPHGRREKITSILTHNMFGINMGEENAKYWLDIFKV